ncbi:MAG: hypothetical protein H6Q68_3160 [Firmicutes bacterium]|nr:hypothetical protein [Bacillota bacterium]
MAQSIITFPSVYHAFRAKKILTDHGIGVELIPIPRELSASCEGLAACMDETYTLQAVEILETKQVVMLQKGIKCRID